MVSWRQEVEKVDEYTGNSVVEYVDVPVEIDHMCDDNVICVKTRSGHEHLVQKHELVI